MEEPLEPLAYELPAEPHPAEARAATRRPQGRAARTGRKSSRQPSQGRSQSREPGPQKSWGIWLGGIDTGQQAEPLPDVRSLVPEDMQGDPEVAMIVSLEEKAAQKEVDGKYVAAAELQEESLLLRRRYLGEEHPGFVQAVEQFVCFCNYWGVQALHGGQPAVALELLKKAETLTEADQVPSFRRRVALRATTFNHLCCYYRSRGKMSAALYLVEKALKLEERFKDSENPARTHLNYAMLLSGVGRHAEAVQHHEQAIATLHDAVATDPGLAVTLVAAYFNLSHDLSKLQRDAGYDCLRRALSLAQNKLGDSHGLTKQVLEAFKRAPVPLEKEERKPKLALPDIAPARPAPKELKPPKPQKWTAAGQGRDKAEMFVGRIVAKHVAGSVLTREEKKPVKPKGAKPLRALRPPKPEVLAPQIRAAYAFHQRKHAKDPEQTEDQNVLLPDAETMYAIAIMKQQTKGRAAASFPMETDRNRLAAAIKIQACWRGYLDRQWTSSELAAEYHRRAHHVGLRPTAQPWITGVFGANDNKRKVALRVIFAARRAYVEYGAAVKIQSFWRGSYTRREIQAEIAVVANIAATKLQALFRRYLVTRETNRQTSAATRIQKTWARYCEVQVSEQYKQAMVMVARHVNLYRAQQQLRQIRGASTCFQKHVRGWLVRRMIRSWHREAAQVQRVVRGWKVRRHVARCRWAVTLIAALVRRRRAQQYQRRRIASASKIQKKYRSRLHARLVKLMEKAERKIASAWRRYVVLRRITILHRLTKMQALIRGARSRIKLSRRQPAATVLSAAFRGFAVRRRLILRCALAIGLQRQARRKRDVFRMRRLKAATVFCQKLARAAAVRRKNRREARIVRPQAAFRMKRLQWKLAQQHAAARFIQSYARGALVRRFLARVRAAVVRIERSWHGVRRRREVMKTRWSHEKMRNLFRGYQIRMRVKKQEEAARQLQRIWSERCSWQKWLKQHATASAIQARFRARRVRKWHRVFRRVLVLQGRWRSRKLQEALETKVWLALVLQALVRGRCVRATMRHRNACARKIQSHWRRRKAKQRTLLRHRAAVQLQAWFKGAHAQTLMLRRERAALRIGRSCKSYLKAQDAVKRGLAVDKMTALVAAAVIRRRWHLVRRAVVTIQAQWRCALLAKRHVRFLKKVTVLQKAMHLWHFQRREIRRLKAAVCIQRRVRGFVARLELARRELASVEIQRCFRGTQVRWELERKDPAATIIQAYYRMRLRKRRYQEKRQTTAKIGRAYLCFVAWRQQKEVITAAIQVSATVRGSIVRRHLARQRDAALQISKVAKGYLARKYVAHLRDVGPRPIECANRCKRATIEVEKARYQQVLQERKGRYWRGVRSEQHTEQATVRIQAFARTRLNCKAYRRKVVFAIPRLQAFARYIACRAWYLRTLAAILTIQRCSQGMLARLRLRRRQEAAAVLQRCFRRCIVSKVRDVSTFSHAHQLHVAALRVQQWWRKELAVLSFQERDQIVTVLQAHLRAYQGLRKKRAKLEAVRMLQRSLVRPWLARRVWQRRFDKLKVLQTAFRRVLARLRCQRIRRSASRIQSFTRSALSRWLISQRREAASRHIGAYFRARDQEKKARRRQQAVLALQSTYRALRVRRSVRREHQAAHRIQQVVRLQRFRASMHKRRRLVCMLQRIWRGSRARWELRRRLAALRRLPGRFRRIRWQHVIQPQRQAGAVALQRLWRGWTGRRDLRRKQRAAARIQAQWRGRQGRRRYAHTRFLQHSLLMIVARKRLRAKRVGTLPAVGRIGRLVKCARPRHLQRLYLRAVTKVQGLARGFLVRARLARRTRAAVQIQRRVKGQRTREMAERRWAGFVRAQAGMWRWLRRWRFHTLRASAVEAQRLARGFLCRLRYARIRAAQKLIARVWRGGVGRELARDRAGASDTILTLAQRFQARTRHRRPKQPGDPVVVNAAVVALWRRLTACMRGCLVRQRLAQQHACATRLRAAWLRSHTRRWSRRLRAAGDRLVCWVFMLQLRRRFVAKQLAARKLAALWRGYCARKRLTSQNDAASRLQKVWVAREKCANAYNAVLWATFDAQDTVQMGRHLASNRIQACYRGRRCRRALRPCEDYRRARAAATGLQTWARRLLALQRVLGTSYIPVPLNIQAFPVKVVGVTTEVVDARHGGVVTTTRVEMSILDVAKLTPFAAWRIGRVCRVVQRWWVQRKRNQMIKRIQRFARNKLKKKPVGARAGVKQLKQDRRADGAAKQRTEQPDPPAADEADGGAAPELQAQE